MDLNGDKSTRVSEYIAASRGADKWTIAEDRGWYVLWQHVGRHTREFRLSTDDMGVVLDYIRTADSIEQSNKQKEQMS